MLNVYIYNSRYFYIYFEVFIVYLQSIYAFYPTQSLDSVVLKLELSDVILT